MNRAEAAKLLLTIEGAYPGRFKSTEEAINVWAVLLGDIPYQIAEQAVAALCSTNVHPPSIAEIRQAVAEAFDSLPSPEEAYEAACNAVRRYSPYVPFAPQLHPLVARALDVVGIQTMAYTDEPTVVSAQFRRVYESLRAREIRRRQQGDMPLLPAAFDERIENGLRRMDQW